MMGDLDKAVVGYTQYLEKAPQDTETLLRRGITHYELKNYKMADRDFKKLIAMKKGGSDVYYFKGMVELKNSKGPLN